MCSDQLLLIDMVVYRINYWVEPEQPSNIKWPSECDFIGQEPIRFSSLRDVTAFYFEFGREKVLIKRSDIKIITYEKTNPLTAWSSSEGILITMNTGQAYFVNCLIWD